MKNLIAFVFTLQCSKTLLASIVLMSAHVYEASIDVSHVGRVDFGWQITQIKTFSSTDMSRLKSLT